MVNLALESRTETPVLNHIHLPKWVARHHAKVTLERQEAGEDFLSFLHPLYEFIHTRISSCSKCGRKYQEAYDDLSAKGYDPDEKLTIEEGP